MNVDAIKTVGVLGAGTMGNGIAHVFAQSGFTVLLRDVETCFLDRALETISRNLDAKSRKAKSPRRKNRRSSRAFTRLPRWIPWPAPTSSSRPCRNGWS